MIRWSLSPVREEDIGVIARIHALSFEDAWSGALIRQVLEMQGTSGLAVRSDCRWSISGFAISRVAADECELLSLAVEPEFRGRGLGKMLLEGVFSQVQGAGVCKLFLEVAEDNGAARNLYRQYGLVPVGRRPDYYSLGDGSRVAALTLCRDFREVPLQEGDVARSPQDFRTTSL